MIKSESSDVIANIINFFRKLKRERKSGKRERETESSTRREKERERRKRRNKKKNRIFFEQQFSGLNSQGNRNYIIMLSPLYLQ